MKKRRWGCVQWSAFVFFGAFFVAALFQSPRGDRIPPSCLSHLKETVLAMLIYSNDYDDRCPPSRWMALMAPYTKDSKDMLDVGQWEGMHYAMNKAIRRADLRKVESPEKVPAFFDTSLDMDNAVSGLESLPNPGRHGGINNAAYADGHVKGIPAVASPESQSH